MAPVHNRVTLSSLAAQIAEFRQEHRCQPRVTISEDVFNDNIPEEARMLLHEASMPPGAFGGHTLGAVSWYLDHTLPPQTVILAFESSENQHA